MKTIARFVVLALVLSLGLADAPAQVPCGGPTGGNCTPIRPIGSANWATGQTTIGTGTPSLLVPSREGRSRVIVANDGSANVACGPDAGVTATTGDIIAGTTGNNAPNVRTTYATQADVWCVSVSGTNLLVWVELW
jgi:hypothetical protein